MIRWLRDWWRGYTDADIWNLHRKMETDARPGEIIYLTRGEGNAWAAGHGS